QSAKNPRTTALGRRAASVARRSLAALPHSDRLHTPHCRKRTFDACLAQPRIASQANESAVERVLQRLRRVTVVLQHLDDALKLARSRLLVRPFGDGLHYGLTLTFSRGECVSADSFEKFRL